MVMLGWDILVEKRWNWQMFAEKIPFGLIAVSDEAAQEHGRGSRNIGQTIRNETAGARFREGQGLLALGQQLNNDLFQLIIAGAENEFGQKLTDDAFGFRDLVARTISMRDQAHIDLADSRTVTDFQSSSDQLL